MSSWPFCPACGSILSTPESSEATISCSSCPYEATFQSLIGEDEQVTRSGKKQKAVWVDEDIGVDDSGVKHATIDEPCPKCGHPELYFYTMQLRSVEKM